jgi:hypothetical protein
MRQVGDYIMDDELIVHREANVHTVYRLACLTRALAWDDEAVSFDVGECGFDVPHAVFAFKARIDRGSRM